MNTAAWVLMALTHVNSGSQVSFQEFDNEQSCTVAAQALVRIAAAENEKVRVQCVSKARGVSLG